MLSVSCTRCSLYDAHPVPGASGNGLLDTGSPSGGGEEGLAIAAVVGTIRCGTGGSPPHDRHRRRRRCEHRRRCDEHAKLKSKLKTKLSSQLRATSPTCVSRVTWGPTQVSCIPDESQKRSHNESHKNNWSEESHKVRGTTQTYIM
jgi:hypothetical protein